MIRDELQLPPTYVYPPDEWRLVERRFYPRRLAQFETLFATANGYLGMRGTFDEGEPVHDRATLINGFHETWPISYAESAFGFARTGQTIVNATDATVIRLLVDDEPLYLPTARLLTYERALDMQAGLLTRDLVWATPAGKFVHVRSRRLVSLVHRHVAAIEYEVTVENDHAAIDIISEVGLVVESVQDEPADPRLARGFTGRVLFPQRSYGDGHRIVLSHKTGRSGMTVACGVDHEIQSECLWTDKVTRDEDCGKLVLSVGAEPGKSIRLVKLITYQTSRRSPADELCERAERTLDRAGVMGMAGLCTAQAEYLAEFWRHGDVECVANPEVEGAQDFARVQQVVRLNLFHILQACARAEGAGVPAKGLTGTGYEGHYFWDTEIYVLPYLLYTEPRLARNLLEFRLGFLEHARERARQVNQRGALFAWRTINGEEASAYYAAGTAQYHINADIVYAMRKYVETTGDRRFLRGPGAEALVETARLWLDLGFFRAGREERFCIAGVTGPDEYNTVVNNNVFTNLMARENLRYAAETVEELRRDDPEAHAALVDHVGLDEREVEQWLRAAEAMELPYDEERGIHLQDDEFLDKKPWDLPGTPPEHFPLLLHYHPLVIYRSRVIKQADVVLAMFLLGDEFTLEQKRRNFEFYDPLTTGDSSLSVCIQSIIAAEIGDLDRAREYARFAALMDLADISRNVKDGCHIASMGGTWMVLVHGMGGFRDYRGSFSFRPRLPRTISRLRFCLALRACRLKVEITPQAARYRLMEGQQLVFRHEDEEIHLTADTPEVSRPLAPVGTPA